MEAPYKQKLKTIQSWLQAGSINIFGRPFAGKDTQGNILAEELRGVLLSGGHILRSAASTPQVHSYIDRGKLLPQEEYLNIIAPFLADPKLAGKPLILSSVGRWHGEEEGVMAAAKAAGHPLRAVIALELSEEEVHDRLKAVDEAREHDAGNKRIERADDTHAALDVRLGEFRNKTLPVLQFYHDLGILIRVDGTQPPELVTQDIVHALYMMAQGE